MGRGSNPLPFLFRLKISQIRWKYITYYVKSTLSALEAKYKGRNAKNKQTMDLVGKIKEISNEINARGLSAEIEADGGITPDNVSLLVENGLTVAVAGSAVFRAQDPALAVKLMKNA